MALDNFIRRYKISDRDFLQVVDEKYTQNIELDVDVDNMDVGFS